MKKNRFLKDGVKAAIAVLLAAGMTLAAGGTVAAQDSQTRRLAAELAASLNAMTKGCAKASKDTVTLTKGIGLQKNLAVPAGVTLDLTKAALALGGGAVFTVNGTVNAKSEGIIVDSAAANPALINGSGTINLKSRGRLLGIGNDRKLTLDGVTLVGLKDNNNSLVEVGEGGEFVLKSGKITGNSRGGSGSGGGVAVWQGIFTMEGGAISDNTTGKAGGGVCNWGTFTMTGGTISGNTAENGGGVASSATQDGKGGGIFTMTGGAITGNAATGSGGGVLVLPDEDDGVGGTFTMEGGAISGNSAGSGGGGVCLWNSTFTLKGGRIQGNTDSDGFTKNTAVNPNAAVAAWESAAKWGTGGAYTQSGKSQTGGSNITDTNDTLIAIPKR